MSELLHKYLDFDFINLIRESRIGIDGIVMNDLGFVDHVNNSPPVISGDIIPCLNSLYSNLTILVGIVEGDDIEVLCDVGMYELIVSDIANVTWIKYHNNDSSREYLLTFKQSPDNDKEICIDYDGMHAEIVNTIDVEVVHRPLLMNLDYFISSLVHSLSNKTEKEKRRDHIKSMQNKLFLEIIRGTT